MIYDYPEYYDIAFSFRDVPREARFLMRAIDRFSQIKVHRILEIACGHAPHAAELTRDGMQYVGLDINKHMLKYAAENCRTLSPQPELIKADMVSFVLEQKVDFAFIMLGSLYFNTPEAMTQHFDSLSNALNSGGLYFMDYCLQFNDPFLQGNQNDFSITKNGITVSSKFDITLLDKQNNLFEEIWTVNVNDHGRQRTFRMTEQNRAVLPEEFLHFIDSRDDFEFINWWRDWDFNQPITHADNIIRPFVIIRKK